MFEVPGKYITSLNLIYEATPEVKPIIEQLLTKLPNSVILHQKSKNFMHASYTLDNVTYTITESQLDEWNQFMSIFTFDQTTFEEKKLALYSIPIREDLPVRSAEDLHFGRVHETPELKGLCIMAEFHNQAKKKKECCDHIYTLGGNLYFPTLYVLNSKNNQVEHQFETNRFFEINNKVL